MFNIHKTLSIMFSPSDFVKFCVFIIVNVRIWNKVNKNTQTLLSIELEAFILKTGIIFLFLQIDFNHSRPGRYQILLQVQLHQQPKSKKFFFTEEMIIMVVRDSMLVFYVTLRGSTLST